jgi:hypothetical protein
VSIFLQFACLPVCPVVDLCYADVVLLEGGGYQQSCQFILASGGQDQTVKLWTVISASGETSISLWQVLSGHSGPVYSIAFSSNLVHLASGSGDKTVLLWDLGTREAVYSMGDHTRYVNTVAFSPNGRALATGSNDKTLRLWKVVDPSTSIGEALDDMEQTPTTVGECQMAKLLSERGMKPGSPVGGWTVDDVTQWLKKIGLQDYEQTFRDNAIDGTELLTLDTQTISEDLGITALGHRNKILRAIRELYSTARECNGVPEEFLCPITMEVMKDPVIASDGYSYERDSILAWLAEGKQTSPMTNLPLSNASLTSNRQLKMLIEKHQSQQPAVNKTDESTQEESEK